MKCEIQFIKVSSYEGTKTTGHVVNLIGLNIDITNRDVIIVEDIVDTGLTISNLKQEMQKLNPNSIKLCTMLYKKRKVWNRY